MAAYAALVSLMNLIDDIQHHHSPPISLHKFQIQSLIEHVIFLQEFLQAYKSPVSDSDEADPLEMRIAKAAYAAEDVIESQIVQKIQHSRSKATIIRSFFNWFPGNVSTNHLDDDRRIELYREVENVIEEMDRIKMVAMETNTEKVMLLHGQPRGVVSSSSGKKNSSMKVISDHVLYGIMEKLMSYESGRQVIPITGMGGIGKTALAQTVYSHKAIIEHFDICAWATISEQYNTREILCELVHQATKKNKEQLSERSAEELGLELYQYLFGRRFLIVMDDMWNIESWDEIKRFFPNNENHSRIMVTTRQSQLASQLNNHYSHSMEFLDEASSWNLLSKTVFEEEPFPLDLEKVGKEIAHNCRGLPLSIVVVGGILKNIEHTTQECWESVRNNLTSIVNLDNNKHCLRLLKMSYNHLPVYLKPCFLYMGVFEEDDEIMVSTLVRLWVSERFLKPLDGQSLETFGRMLIKDLVDRNLVLVDKLGSMGNIKQVKVHDLVRDLCVKQGMQEGFYHVVGKSGLRGIKSHRRIVIRRNTSKKKVLDHLQSMSHARSIICHDEKVLQGWNFRLLKTIHAYEFIINFDGSFVNSRLSGYVNLRHLDVKVAKMSSTFSSFGHLWNLQTLIVYCGTEPTVPIEIWKMPQLRHIAIYKFSGFMVLPDPSSDDVVMENLVVLKGVLNFKCDKEVVKRIPNINKLHIFYTEHDDDYCMGNIECLGKLEYLKIILGGSRAAGFDKLMFPRNLKSLNLYASSGFDWEMMLEKIGSLPLLEKFKMKSGCFGAGKWEICEGQFPSLKYLELFLCHSLKHWTAEEESSIFPRLEKLHLTYLKGLENIPSEIGYIPTLKSIQMDNCCESVVKFAKEIVLEQMDCQGEDLSFNVYVQLWRFDKEEAVLKELQSLSGPNFEVVII